MRQMSFALTEQQLLDGSKTVTRRLGWGFLKPGERLRAIRKGMGLKRGEKQVVLGVIEVLDVWFEPLWRITAEHVAKEGFPDWTRKQFIDFFCTHNRCVPYEEVTVIRFRLVEKAVATAAQRKGD